MTFLVDTCNINIVLKRFIAGRVSKEKSIGFIPFTYTVKTIKWASAKAVGVIMTPHYGNTSVCSCCGKQLTDWRSQATGMGITCANRLGIAYIKSQADVAAFKAAVTAKFAAIGDIETTLPKSQIVDGLNELNMAIAPVVPTSVSISPVPAVKHVERVATGVPTISTTKLTYNEATHTFSGEDSSLNTGMPESGVYIINPETGNKIFFVHDHDDIDNDGDLAGVWYRARIRANQVNLLIIND